MSETTLSQSIEQQAYEALRTVYDPELGINVVDLGLIYSVRARDGEVLVQMTLTTPGCPLHDSMSQAVEAAIWRAVPGVRSVEVELVWSPPWNPTMISEAGKAQLGWGF